MEQNVRVKNNQIRHTVWWDEDQTKVHGFDLHVLDTLDYPK